MKKNVLVFGSIAGLITAGMFAITLLIGYENIDHGMLIGYTTQFIAFSLIFVAIKNYRDKYNAGVVTFGKAFKLGLYITLIASAIYVITWAIEYNFFVPDFLDRYEAHEIKKLVEKGASQAKIDDMKDEIAKGKVLYQNPFFFTLMTLGEIFPTGLIMSIVGALILKRKEPKAPVVA